MRGWRKEPTEGACYGQKTIGEINGLRRGNSAQTAAGSLELTFRSATVGVGWVRCTSTPRRKQKSPPARIFLGVHAEIGAAVAVPPVEGGAV
jgi:hypothetical protein